MYNPIEAMNIDLSKDPTQAQRLSLMARKMNDLFYPAPYVKHPDILHVSMTDKLFPYMEPRRLTLGELKYYYKTTYMVLCKSFDEYLEYREEEFWENFKNKNKRNHK